MAIEVDFTRFLGHRTIMNQSIDKVFRLEENAFNFRPGTLFLLNPSITHLLSVLPPALLHPFQLQRTLFHTCAPSTINLRNKVQQFMDHRNVSHWLTTVTIRCQNNFSGGGDWHDLSSHLIKATIWYGMIIKNTPNWAKLFGEFAKERKSFRYLMVAG